MPASLPPSPSPSSLSPPAKHPQESVLLHDPGETRVLSHLVQLDGVRAVAVLLVLVHHLGPKGYNGGGLLGAVGVGLFFVLSGFLITRILLKCRLERDAGHAPTGRLLWQFYIRRFLRIFPLYYLVLAILFAFNVTGIRERIGWHLAYLTNLFFSYVDPGKGMAERHLWSLSVEEQFYIFWPVLILVVPRRLLPWLLGLTVLAGPAWRYYVTYEGYTRQYSNIVDQWMTPGCLDLLGTGAVLALLSMKQFGLTRWRTGFVEVCGFIGVPLLLIWGVFPVISERSSGIWLQDRTPYVGTALAGAWLVASAATGFAGPIGKLLASRPMIYTGRISYGLYVWHMFVRDGVLMLFARYDARPTDWQLFYITVPATFVVATASWYAFEAPINGLKRYFEYGKSPVRQKALATQTN